jgi:hypothetical protein
MFSVLPGTPPAHPDHREPLHHRLGVCWDCVNHQDVETADAKFARGRQHGRLLGREYRAMRDRITELRDELAQAERELAMRPTTVTVRVENLDKIIVDAAHKDRDEAYRSRDVAMGALSDVRLLHHKDPDDKVRCVCGTRYDQCKEAQLVDRWDGVLFWERTHAREAHRGRRHRLDREHPAIKDPQYFDRIYGDAD